MRNYLQLLEKILIQGHQHDDRTGTGRISLYGETLRFKMADGFPLVTSRRVPYKAALKEMLWFISGSCSTIDLQNQNVHIWDQWAVKEQNIQDFLGKIVRPEDDPSDVDNFRMYLQERYLGSIGEMYGYNWRNWPSASSFDFAPPVTVDMFAPDKIDDLKNRIIPMVEHESKKIYQQILLQDPSFQIKEDEFIAMEVQKKLNYHYYNNIDQLNELVRTLREMPYGSRHVMSVWRPDMIPFMKMSPEENVLRGRGALAPCHILVQCHVVPPEPGHKPKLILQLYQRSADFPIGSVFNIAQYAFLLHLLARTLGYEPYELIYNLGDVHIYKNQVEMVKEHLNRPCHTLPKLHLADHVTTLFNVGVDDFELLDYQHEAPISYPIS